MTLNFLKGYLAEWSKALHLRCSGEIRVGSNPTVSITVLKMTLNFLKQFSVAKLV